MPPSPLVLIVSPALADANNGNWRTAARWQRFLQPLAQVRVAQAWQGEPADVLVALHARRSAPAIDAYRTAHPARPIVLVLTGTDLYRDLPEDRCAQRSLALADALVVLQAEALQALPHAARTKAQVILQSAARVRLAGPPLTSRPLVAVGHLREEKDPQTLWRALPLLEGLAHGHVHHYGAALEPALAQQARQAEQAHPGYRWMGGVPAAVAHAALARSRALVHMSRMEGGANVVIEAVRAGVPVLASRIPGNVGLLGQHYGGYFEPGDAHGLADLARRLLLDAEFEQQLRAQCAARDPLFEPARERAAVQALLQALLAR